MCSSELTGIIAIRVFAQVICDDVYSWWFEMGTGKTSYYNHPEVVDIFRQQQRIAKENDQLGRGKVSEIAVGAKKNIYIAFLLMLVWCL